jgi:hypothetical protein
MVKYNPKNNDFPRQFLTNNEDNNSSLAKLSEDTTVNNDVYSYNASDVSDVSENIIVLKKEGDDY